LQVRAAPSGKQFKRQVTGLDWTSLKCLLA
jgi:hypothetical protein